MISVQDHTLGDLVVLLLERVDLLFIIRHSSVILLSRLPAVISPSFALRFNLALTSAE